MQTLSVGKRNRTRAGVTLIEMVVVVALIAIVVGLTFPSMGAGVETLRLNAACQSTVSFLNGGLNRAERHQVVVEITISKADNTLAMRSSEPGFDRKLELPEGIKIESILPELPEEDAEAPRSFLLYPGGTVPGFGVVLVNRKQSERVVRVDPITGVPAIVNPNPPEAAEK